jgi:subtilase family serine protease
LALEGTGQSVGLFELDGYTLSDVQTYFTNVGEPLNVTINNVLVDGASAGSDGDDTEQVIDIIEAISMAPALSQVRVYIGPQSTFTVGKTDTDIFNKMATDDITKQISCSWTWKPDDPGSVSQSGTNDYILNEMESQGQNMFVASGDYGSYPNSTAWYYPAEDAHVVGVGGTILTTSSAGGPWKSEIAWGTTTTSCSGYSSGGGISPDKIPIPSYQQLSGVINSSNGGSTSYRNVPDVAAEANCDNYYCANGSCGTTLGGTSLAAPTWAGFMALVNQQEEANHDTTLGFLNPLIYAIGVSSSYDQDFHDITSGTNGAFNAVTGYDLVTGWGSMNGCGLITALAGSCPEVTASVSPTYLSLTSEDKQPASGVVTLSNNGPSPLFLAVSSTSITGSSYFLVTAGSCEEKTEWPYPGSCTVQVTFHPVSCAGASGVLYIYDNSTTSPQYVDLSGRVLNCKT